MESLEADAVGGGRSNTVRQPELCTISRAPLSFLGLICIDLEAVDTHAAGERVSVGVPPNNLLHPLDQTLTRDGRSGGSAKESTRGDREAMGTACIVWA